MVEFWQSLSKSKKPGGGKPGEKNICTRLCETHKDVLFPVLKLIFFNEIANELMIFSQSFRLIIQQLFFAADFKKFMFKVHLKRYS